ncbi:MAG: ABC transporter ATP-binding protein [Eisenbergiella massiliensis]
MRFTAFSVLTARENHNNTASAWFSASGKGFLPHSGHGLFHEAAVIQKSLGYLAGRSLFLRIAPATASPASGGNERDYGQKPNAELMELLELDPSGRVRKCQRHEAEAGHRKCLGNPEIVILDEPTSGLDPLMQNRFIELILEEKRREPLFLCPPICLKVERTCERTAIIRQGEIAAIEDMEGLKKKRTRDYIITLDSKEAADALVLPGFSITRREGCQVTVAVKGDIPRLLSLLSECSVRDLQIHTQTLEEIFLHYYGGEKA